MQQSTRKMIRMHGWRLDRALHNYIYFTRYDSYVEWFLRGGRIVRDYLGNVPLMAPMFKMVFDRYHAKVITLEDTKKILSLNRSIDMGEASEMVIPMKYARKILLSEPDHIAVMDCPCRKSRENPCLPLNVCMAVGSGVVGFWLEHGEKYNVRKISQEEALTIIQSERQKGRITTAWFKVATGGRTGVICSCCTCCCGGLEGMRIVKGIKGGEKLSNIIPSGYKIAHEDEKCDSCGKCAEVCMFGAITLSQEGRPLYDPAACYGCGLCVEHCPEGARTLSTDFKDILPLDLEDLEKRVPAG